MSSTSEMHLQSSNSLSMANNEYECHSDAEVIATITLKDNDQEQVQLPNTLIFILTVKNLNKDTNDVPLRKKLSIDSALVSYSFLVHVINRLFQFQSNFIIKTKNKLVIVDDFDLDGCTINELNKSTIEFLIELTEDDQKSPNDEDEVNDNFEILTIDNDCYVITVKSVLCRQETFIQKATSWLHGTVHASSNRYLTRKEFNRMLDPSNGRLLNETRLRERIYEDGCEPEIRDIVWCYLFRIFNQTMTNQDKTQYVKKAKERYNEMKQAWQKNEHSYIKDVLNSIQKDVTRTDNSLQFFDRQKNVSKQKLLNILMTYCIYHPIPGYVQGMTDMLTPILYVMRDEALAYACFSALMHYMSPLFHTDGVAINRRFCLLKRTIQGIDTELWNQIEACDTGKIMFTYRWLLLDCKREFPFKDIFHVFETVWASLPIDRFELNNDSFSDMDEFTPIVPFTDRHLSTTTTTASSSVTNTILSSRSQSPVPEELQSEHSSVDESDSGYLDEQHTSLLDLTAKQSNPGNLPSRLCIPLGKWLESFSCMATENDYSDMFTIFLCVALLEQNRASIMQLSASNFDNDDCLGVYFARLTRKNDAQQALNLARNYHRQYIAFQMRVKQLQSLRNK